MEVLGLELEGQVLGLGLEGQDLALALKDKYCQQKPWPPHSRS